MKNTKQKKEKETKNILISGVGGQGILLAAELIGLAAQLEGYDVKKSEVHGMAQRGGSVNSHIRIGQEIFSPTIPLGEADFLLAFEPLEALRFCQWLKKGGICIFNSQKLVPVSSFITGIAYPQNVGDILKSNGFNVLEANATEEAKKMGNIRTVNVILLGILSKFLPLKNKSWETALKQSVKPQFYDINNKAFETGKNISGGLIK